MKKVISFILTITIIMIAILGINTKVIAASIQKLNISVKYGQTEARTMLNMINDLRTGKDAWYWDESNSKKIECNNLEKLTYDYELEKVAMKRAAEIAAQYYPSHFRPNGEICFTAYEEMGVYSYWLGENIAAGYQTAKSVFVGWKEDDELYEGQGHRRNMLNEGFTSVGIGHVYYNNFHYWVQEFGDSQNTPETSANDKTTNVTLDVLDSNIKQYSIEPSISSIKLERDKQASIPTIKASAKLIGNWPDLSEIPLNTSVEWNIENKSYAKISGNKVIGLKTGKTNLITTVYGKKISIPITIVPNKIEGVKVKKVNSTSIKLSWTKMADITGYKIYRYNKKTNKYEKIATTKSNSYTAKKLQTKTTYKFKILAYKTINKKDYDGTSSNVISYTKAK